MAHTFRPFRSRFARLLASTLVVASLLGNGLAVAQAQSVPTKKPCCAEQMSHLSGQQGHCDDAGKPCPTPSTNCDDQCLAWCQSNVTLPNLAVVMLAQDSSRLVLPPVSAEEQPLTDPGPGLRPPISA